MDILRKMIQKILSETIDKRATAAVAKGITFSFVDAGHEATIYCFSNGRQIGRLDCMSTWINERVWLATDAQLEGSAQGIGIGSLMFDIMMAHLSKKRLWLAPDTRSVSQAALPIYEWYHNHPEDYSSMQLDISPRRSDGKIFLTPEDNDDFDTNSVFDYIGGHSDPDYKDEYSDDVYDDEEYKEKFINHCLTKAYRMKKWGPFIENLPEDLVKWPS
jgi:hypothetical protein